MQRNQALAPVFDFGRISVDPGEILPRSGFNQNVDTRMIETVLEFLFFFTIGLMLIVQQQMVGYLILLNSIGILAELADCLLSWQPFYHGHATIDEMLFSQQKSQCIYSLQRP